jgi:phage tail-like protein
MAQTGERTEPHAAFRFAVEIDGIDAAYFTECDLPSLEVEVIEQKEGGFNTGVHQIPGPVKSGRLTLKRGLVQSNELLKWYKDVADGKLKDAERNVSIVMYDAEWNEVIRWNFEHVFPVKWSGPSFRSAENTIAIETLELVFTEASLK